MRQWVCLNGTLVPAEEARVSVFDSGFMQGVGLFETMRAYDGVVFRLQRHLDRLADSARALGWTVIPEPEDTADNVRQVLSTIGRDDARVRLTVTTGSLHAAADDSPQLTIVATASPATRHPDEYYTNGVTVVVSKYRQSAHDPTVGHKTTSYFARLASLREAHAQAAFEALWLTEDGRLAEGAISSVFVVRDEQLLTPPLDTPVLPGVTRATVIELAVGLDIPVREKPLTLEEVLAADEMFLTGSMLEVMPVVRVAREPIGNEKPGDLTRQLAVAYTELVARECGGE